MLMLPEGLAVADATRPLLWNTSLPMVLWLYGSSAAAAAVCGWGIWRRARVWRVGVPDHRGDQWPRRLKRLALDAIAQRRVLREAGGGLPHALLFFGFLALLLATAILMVHQDFGLPIMRGRLYLWFQSLAANILGFGALLAVVAAAVRRYLLRPPGLERNEPSDGLLLAGLFLLLATGFAVSGLRLVATADPWAAWRPVALGTGLLLGALLPAGWIAPVHAALWLLHVTLWTALLALLPFSKLAHAVFAPIALWAGNLKRGTDLPRIDFEAEEPVLGVRDPLDLGWKQLLELDACTECGRCERACPAHTAGFPLSPKRLVLDLRKHVRAHAPALLRAHALRATDAAAYAAARAELAPIGGSVEAADAIWACTTCRSCEHACPVGVEHVRLVLQLRQNLAMERAEMPEGVAQLPRQLELREHPFCGVPVDRHAWFADAEPVGAQPAEVVR